MSLRREIKKEDLEDRFGNIPVPPRTRAIEVDMNLSPLDHINVMLNERLTIGEAEYNERVAIVNQKATQIEQRQEALRQKKITENEAIRASQRQPLNLYAAAFNSNDPTALIEFFPKQSTEVLTGILKQLGEKPRFWNSVFHSEITRAIETLKNEIASRNAQPHDGILTKLRKLGAP